MVINPNIFQVLIGGIILYKILKYMINEEISYYKKNNEKPSKKRNDIQLRLKKANARYYNSL